MARTTGSEGSRTEEAIRQAAVGLIAARGFEATTMRQIAAQVGIQPGAVYRYFPSKAALLVDLQVGHLDFLLGHWQAERPATDDPVALLRAFVAFHIRFHTLRRKEVANMELRSLAPADYKRVVALRRRYESILTDILRDGMRGGVFTLPDPRVATFAILAMLTGVGSWYRDGGRLGKRELIDVHTRMVMQCVGAVSPHAETTTSIRVPTTSGATPTPWARWWPTCAPRSRRCPRGEGRRHATSTWRVASSCPASGCASCSIRVHRSWSCRSWPPGTCTVASARAAASSPASAGSPAGSA